MTPAAKAAPPFPLRCPSCAHGNPAAANFCNHCGMPVNLEPCRFCESINRRTDVACHKCGILLARPPEMSEQAKQEMATAAAGPTATASAERRAASAPEVTKPVDARPPSTREQRTNPDLRPAARDGGMQGSDERPPAGGPVFPSVPGNVERREPTVGMEGLRQAAALAVDDDGEKATAERQRGRYGRLSVLFVLLAAVGAGAFFAARDPARFQDGIDAVKGKVDAAWRAMAPRASPGANESSPPPTQPLAPSPAAPETAPVAPETAPAPAAVSSAVPQSTLPVPSVSAPAAESDAVPSDAPAVDDGAPSPPAPGTGGESAVPVAAASQSAKAASRPTTAQRSSVAKSTRQSSARSRSATNQAKSARRDAKPKSSTTRNRATSRAAPPARAVVPPTAVTDPP